ncbi:MAG: succinylglutamate desuccinylase/aspartoacylase family protein [Patescibacteria group bacterium]
MFLSLFSKKSPKLDAIELLGNAPGKTLLITAGMDGDEYVGIAAAHEIARRFSARPFSGKLILIPIVNMPGFMNESSHNPIDGKFPKMLFPGNANGSSTEQIVASLAPHAFATDCWLDLHSGAMTEGLNPFLWFHRTGKADVDVQIERFVSANIADRVLIESCPMGTKAAQLAKRGCMYVVAESGARGNRDGIDLERHIRWAEAMMSLLGMIDTPIAQIATPIVVMNQIRYVVAPHDGIWDPSVFATETIKKNDVIGIARSIKGGKPKTIAAPVAGYRLWWKETMRMKKGDVLCAIGF